MIIPTFFPLAVSDPIYDYVNYVYYGSLVVYLIFGPFWFWNRVKEQQ